MIAILSLTFQIRIITKLLCRPWRTFFMWEFWRKDELVLLNVDVSSKAIYFSSTCLKTSYFCWDTSTALLSLLLGCELIQLSTASNVHALAFPKLIIFLFSQNLSLVHTTFPSFFIVFIKPKIISQNVSESLLMKGDSLPLHR